MNWNKELSQIIRASAAKVQADQTSEEQAKEQIREFFSVVCDAFGEIKVEIEKHQRHVEIHTGKAAIALDVFNGARMEFTYAVKVHRYAPSSLGGYNFYKSNSFDSRDNVQRYHFAKIHTIDKQRIIKDFIRAYTSRLRARGDKQL